MEVIHLEKVRNKLVRPVLTLGMFDGVHLGHQKILEQLNARAKEIGGSSVLLTFNPHPRFVLQEDSPLRLLTPLKEKKFFLQQYDLNHLLIQAFTKDFSRLTAVEFIRDVLVNKIGIHTLIVGHDHQFGRNREGDFSQLKELSELYGFQLEQINAQSFSDIVLSSTKMRNALLDGDLKLANAGLNRPYEIWGDVMPGDGIGTGLGFPTANLKVSSEKLIPKRGVYAAKVFIGDEEKTAVMNIGFRPTFQNDEQRIEVHILNFSGDLYGTELRVQLLDFLREEQKFENQEALKEQITRDVEQAKSLSI